jgi:hypothetical protein
LVLFDTDILIWVQRGDEKAARLVDDAAERCLSIYSYMELLQGAKGRKQHEYVIDFLKEFGFQMLAMTENIGYRAAVYVEEYTLSNGLRAGDAIIAATAVQHGMVLCTGDQKHFKAIQEVRLKVFHP